jgi:hypothetical protein
MEMKQVDHNKVVRINQFLKLIKNLGDVKEADRICGGKHQAYYNREINRVQQDLLNVVRKQP